MIQVGNFSTEEFVKLLDDEAKIVIIGAGEALRKLCERYKKLASCIQYVADNYKVGTIDLAGYTVPIRRLEQCGESKDLIFLLSSVLYAVELINQLDQLKCFDNATIYVPALFTGGMEGNEKSFFQPHAVQLIPKTIHYCWFGRKELPSQFQRNIETWKQYCPDYEIVRWDEDNYDISKNLYMKQAYEKNYWGFVSDYARLDIVNTYGGVYLDTDVELLKPLDDLLQFRLYCGFENMDYVNFGLGYGSEKNSPILQDMLSLYDRMAFICPDGTVNLTPCPVYQTNVLETYGLIKNGQTQVKSDFTALSPEYLCPMNQCEIGEPTERSFSVHQFAATWHTPEQKAKKERTSQICKFLFKRMMSERIHNL